MPRMATARSTPLADATPSIGGLIDKLFEIREQTRALNKQAEELKVQKDDYEARLLAALDAQGVTQSRGEVATATVSEAEVPQVEDWDKFYAFIARNKAFYMLERRPAAGPYREAMQLRKGRAIPGVKSFTKRTISLRTR